MKAPGSSAYVHFPIPDSPLAHLQCHPSYLPPFPFTGFSFKSFFNRDPVLRDGLTKIPGNPVYFKALLPSCALSFEFLSLWGSLNHSPSACGICLQHGEAAGRSHGHGQPSQNGVTCCLAISALCSSLFGWKKNQNKGVVPLYSNGW